LHLVTAADGALDFYNLDNNEARAEDPKLAIKLDRTLQRAWCYHPEFYVVDNSGDGFNEKIMKAENYILKTLGMPTSTEFHKKFLVRDPEEKLFNYLAKQYGQIVFYIKDCILENTDEEMIYLRKRVIQCLILDYQRKQFLPERKEEVYQGQANINKGKYFLERVQLPVRIEQR
jgi:hypothetical protein